MEKNKEIERTLNSLDNLQKAEMHPFLYEKIKHRMVERANEKNTGTSFSWKLASVLLLVIFLNVFTCWKYKTQEENKNNVSSINNTNTDNYYYNTGYNY